MYIHTSTEETYLDSFTFSVSDGSHDVIRTFSITISPVDDSIPVVVSNGLKVQEGVRKIITEFDLKATDKDTKVIRISEYEPLHDKTNKMVCVPSEDSDQPEHPPSLIKVFVCAQWVANGPMFLHVDSKDSDRTGRMSRLI